MYANETRVRHLAKNRKSSLPTAEIQSLAEDVDARINSELAGAFYWPTDPNGANLSANPPAIVITIATYLTAAAIEYESYAQRNADGVPMTSLGSLYEKKATKMLADLINGRSHATEAAGLVRPIAVGHRSAPCPPEVNPCHK